MLYILYEMLIMYHVKRKTTLEYQKEKKNSVTNYIIIMLKHGKQQKFIMK